MKSISLLRSRALLTRNTLIFSSESCVLDRLERARNSRCEIAGDSLVPVERGDASGRRRARSAGGQKGRGSRGQAPRPAGAATPASHWRPALRGHLCPVLATQGAGSRGAGRVFLRIFEGQGIWQKVIARPLQATPGTEEPRASPRAGPPVLGEGCPGTGGGQCPPRAWRLQSRTERPEVVLLGRAHPGHPDASPLGAAPWAPAGRRTATCTRARCAREDLAPAARCLHAPSRPEPVRTEAEPRAACGRGGGEQPGSEAGPASRPRTKGACRSRAGNPLPGSERPSGRLRRALPASRRPRPRRSSAARPARLAGPWRPPSPAAGRPPTSSFREAAGPRRPGPARAAATQPRR